jgi:glutathione S-transferase
MKLFDMAGAPNPRRVRVFLAEKGIDVEKVQIDIMKRFMAQRPKKRPLSSRGFDKSKGMH